MQYFVPLGHQGYKIYSPACTNSPAGFSWIQQFVSQVEQEGGWVRSSSVQSTHHIDKLLQVDGVLTHIYTTDFNAATSFLTSFVNAFPGKEIWVTEYACEVRPFHYSLGSYEWWPSQLGTRITPVITSSSMPREFSRTCGNSLVGWMPILVLRITSLSVSCYNIPG